MLSVRLGDSLGLDDSVLEAIKFDHSLNALTLADEPVSLVDLVEVFS